jgi:lipid II:glycine glycyltransferase (peptidoglycan interpeptide bridge formation enzyme)
MELRKFSIFEKEIHDFISLNSNCIFHSQDWLKILKEGLNSEVYYYALLDQGKLVIVLSAILLNFKFIKISYSNIPYGGFVGRPEYIPEFLLRFEKKLKEEGVQIIRITKRFNENFDISPEYRMQSGYQQIINIAGLTEENLWKGYKKRVRRDVLKAEKSGVKIKNISDRSEIEKLFGLYQDTLQRNNAFATWTKKFFYSIYDDLILKGKADIIFSELNNKYIAGTVLIYSQDTVYYFMNASLTDYLSHCPNDILLHNAIILGIKKNKKYFDLMTSRDTDTALLKFKEKWGSECHPFYIFEKDLDNIRAKIWNQAWKITNSKLGTSLIRFFRK